VIDDPHLTARPGGTTEGAHQPLRVVVDSRGRTPDEAVVLQGASPTLIATTALSPELWRERMRGPGTEVVVLPARDGHVDLEALLRELGRRGALTVLFEGGGILLGSLFDARLVDRVHAVIAPMIVGADAAPAAVAGHGAQRMADAVRLRDLRVERLGDDVLFDGLVVWPDGDSSTGSG
jgi:diaminohydroxyphosphoribosylaminopyrimidine deaminase/5-amino-6-(5-phosphoribosylamino)uracil reductase